MFGRTPAKTVIVTGMSRSGTTLLTTLLDAHPDISMCYDVVPRKMSARLEEGAALLGRAIEKIGRSDLSALENVRAYRALRAEIRGSEIDALAWPLVALRRSGMTPLDLLRVLEQRLEAGQRFLESAHDRLQVAKGLLDLKRATSATPCVGLKVSLPTKEILNVLPDARFVAIVRDPRDVIASHLTRDWNDDIDHLGKKWNNLSSRYLKMLDSRKRIGTLVLLEDIILNQEEASRQINEFLRLSCPNFIDGFAERSSVFQIPEAFSEKYQLFWDQGLSKSKMGAWRNVLSHKDASRIDEICRVNMTKLGYKRAPQKDASAV